MRKLSRAGQHTIEYTLLIVAVFLVIFFTLSPNGLITNHVKQSVELSTQMVECMPYSICYEANGCPPVDGNGCCEKGEPVSNADCGGFCGDGIITPPEQCDDGNNISGDGCANCQSTVCGDGIVTPPEQCDDGNNVSGDGCDNCLVTGGNPVNGAWCAWTDFSNCTVLCGGGTITRTRACACPAPSGGGANCVGSPQESQPCNIGPCDGNAGMPFNSPTSVPCTALQMQIDPFVGCTPCTNGQQYNVFADVGTPGTCEYRERICVIDPGC